MRRRVAVEVVYCLRNRQSGRRHRSKSSRAYKNTSICRPLIQTTQTCSLPLRYPIMITAAVDIMVEQQLPYIAAESITSSRFTFDEVLQSKRSIACAITNSAVDIGRRAAGQINTSTGRLLIQTTQTWSLPLRYPTITAAVDLMIEQQ